MSTKPLQKMANFAVFCILQPQNVRQNYYHQTAPPKPKPPRPGMRQTAKPPQQTAKPNPGKTAQTKRKTPPKPPQLMQTGNRPAKPSNGAKRGH